MAYTHIDTTEERFGSKVSIAHLAANTFNDISSDRLHIYLARDMAEADWKPEIEGYEFEYLSGIHLTFKDGSKLGYPAFRVDERLEPTISQSPVEG